MAWTTPDDVRAQVQRLWDRGCILAARLGGEPLFPHAVRMKRPQVRELSDRFAEARAWIRTLEEGSKSAVGAGYEVIYTEVNHRQLGVNRVPQSLVVPSEEDALALIGKRRQANCSVGLSKQPGTRTLSLCRGSRWGRSICSDTPVIGNASWPWSHGFAATPAQASTRGKST